MQSCNGQTIDKRLNPTGKLSRESGHISKCTEATEKGKLDSIELNHIYGTSVSKKEIMQDRSSRKRVEAVGEGSKTDADQKDKHQFSQVENKNI